MLMGASPPPEVAATYEALMKTAKRGMAGRPQSATDCAAFYLRAATDDAPALRYLTWPPFEGMVRSKFVDVDGAGAAAAVLTMIDALSSSAAASE